MCFQMVYVYTPSCTCKNVHVPVVHECQQDDCRSVPHARAEGLYNRQGLHWHILHCTPESGVQGLHSRSKVYYCTGRTLFAVSQCSVLPGFSTVRSVMVQYVESTACASARSALHRNVSGWWLGCMRVNSVAPVCGG